MWLTCEGVAYDTAVRVVSIEWWSSEVVVDVVDRRSPDGSRFGRRIVHELSQGGNLLTEKKQHTEARHLLGCVEGSDRLMPWWSIVWWSVPSHVRLFLRVEVVQEGRPNLLRAGAASCLLTTIPLRP